MIFLPYNIMMRYFSWRNSSDLLLQSFQYFFEVRDSNTAFRKIIIFICKCKGL